jgi:hypothetical protein
MYVEHVGFGLKLDYCLNSLNKVDTKPQAQSNFDKTSFQARSNASIRDCVGWSVGRLVGWSVCPHDEILRNLLIWKTGDVAIASRLGFGVTSLFT